MTSRIRVLTDHTINKIAAGEVIENASSVVKELVENAIDAQATDITVEIKGGGRQLIRVTDNGHGMSPDDALLCLERHATSKIRSVEDLQSLDTMGFRGEAIPSIAAISKFMLLTRPKPEGDKDPLGTMVTVDGGQVVQCCPAACAYGTTIEVKGLFFNVPVRKKFLKSPAHDIQEILKMMTLLALSHPQIKFQLISNQESLLSCPVPNSKNSLEQLGERISAVLGADFYRTLCPLEIAKDEFTLQGYIGLPSHTRHNRTGQYLFINQRAVVSPFVSFAIREGYGPMLGTNRYPLFVLHLAMPGSLVDVNVHPQKKEVRLRQEHVLKELIIQGIEGTLQQTGQSPIVELPSLPTYVFEPTVMEPKAWTPPPPKPPVPPTLRIPNEEPRLFKPESKPECAPPRVLTTLPGYIIVDPAPLEKFANDGLCIVDQRSAHARVIYEKLSQISQKEIPVQTLLIPYTLECTPPQAALLRQQLQQWNAVGISLREFGPTTFLVDALPLVIGHADVGELLADLLERMSEDHTLQQEHARLLAFSATRVAISRAKRMSLEQAQGLINQLMQCRHPYQCPQGKPTITQMKAEELAKLFAKG